eukprot:6182420-Pleurochrysis_carterae.AAC.5
MRISHPPSDVTHQALARIGECMLQHVHRKRRANLAHMERIRFCTIRMSDSLDLGRGEGPCDAHSNMD